MAATRHLQKRQLGQHAVLPLPRCSGCDVIASLPEAAMGVRVRGADGVRHIIAARDEARPHCAGGRVADASLPGMKPGPDTILSQSGGDRD